MLFRPNNSLLLAGTKLISTYKSLELTPAKGVRKGGGGLGLNPPPLSSTFYKNFISWAKDVNLQKLYFLHKGD